MTEYCLSDFVDGYNRLNKRRFSDSRIIRLLFEFFHFNNLIAVQS